MLQFPSLYEEQQKFVWKWWVSILFINIWKYWFSVQSPKSKYYFWVVMHRNNILHHTGIGEYSIVSKCSVSSWTLKLKIEPKNKQLLQMVALLNHSLDSSKNKYLWERIGTFQFPVMSTIYSSFKVNHFEFFNLVKDRTLYIKGISQDKI